MNFSRACSWMSFMVISERSVVSILSRPMHFATAASASASTSPTAMMLPCFSTLDVGMTILSPSFMFRNICSIPGTLSASSRPSIFLTVPGLAIIALSIDTRLSTGSRLPGSSPSATSTIAFIKSTPDERGYVYADMKPPESLAASSPIIAPFFVTLMSPFAAPEESPRARIPCFITSQAFLRTSAGSDEGIVCPVSTKCGGYSMILSATPVIVISLLKIMASMESSGPSMNCSMISSPLGDALFANLKASETSFALLILITPRAPILSLGFITRGNPSILQAFLASESDQTGRNAGDGTSNSLKRMRILILFVAASASSNLMPGRFRALATAATVMDASVPTVSTPLMGVISFCRLAILTDPCMSLVLMMIGMSASFIPMASGL